ncbi:MAG TPA: dehypoxanthine futalosine cyclase [Chloroflexi bacterium]|nr:dehypoxanthine futalosine cyclase [Chloroflexota bacterium]|tara:strand:- start:1858 stop:2958 length:1101 start_codon:yes stop_codon:yes gene_type:complete
MDHITTKIDAGDRISEKDLLYLLTDAPLLEMGALADRVRHQRHPGETVTYVVDTNLNYTNLCDAYCSFCAFYRPHTSTADDAYTHTVEEMMTQVAGAASLGCTTVLMQGGLNPELPLDYYVEMVRETRARFPGITPHYWSAPEIYEMAKVSGLGYHQVFEALWEAGQRTLPGGGAEVLTNEERHRISPLKMDADEWIEIHQAAHEVGFRGTATMMYGHGESIPSRVEHFQRTRDLQDRNGGFYAFVPWSFSPGETPLGRKLNGLRANANDYLRIIAAARLYFDNIDHVDASWFSEGKKTGQVALHFGADDFGGTLFDENVMQEAGHYVRTSVEEMRTMIREAGFVPAQRNTQYEVLEVFNEDALEV